MDKSKFKDSKGRYIVQGLFLEDRYDKDMAVFTFDGEDKVYKGKTYISLKKRFLEFNDPKEYMFARTYLYDWNHWKRLSKNAVVGRHIEEWRKELELSLVSEGVSALVDLALNEKSYQAAKYLAECGWNKEKVGRPSKEQVQGELQKQAAEEKEFEKDFELFEIHKEGSK